MAGIGQATLRTHLGQHHDVRYVLVVKEGPDAGTQFAIEESEGQRILCGTGPLCTLRITDPTVSRRHAAFAKDAAGLHVYDYGSTNGTVINGVSVREALLVGGEEIRLGTTMLEVRVTSVEAGPPASAEPRRFGRMLSVHPAMHRIFRIGEKLAQTTLPYLVEGEGGVGKKVFVESVLESGPNPNEPIVVLEATVLPPETVEAVLFGVTAEASKDGVERPGLFAEAGRGVVIIDGPCDLDPAIQRKLLRTIERGEYSRVGDTKVETTKARIVATSREDVDRAVELGRLREDLFQRLAAARVEVPSLRTRTGDVELLAEHVWATLSERKDSLPGDVLTRLQKHSWPGNVRELESAVQRQFAVGEAFAAPSASRVTAEGATLGLHAYVEGGLPLVRAREELVRDFERAYVAHMLERHGGNVRRAAAAAGVAHRYFQLLKSRLT